MKITIYPYIIERLLVGWCFFMISSTSRLQHSGDRRCRAWRMCHASTHVGSQKHKLWWTNYTTMQQICQGELVGVVNVIYLFLKATLTWLTTVVLCTIVSKLKKHICLVSSLGLELILSTCNNFFLEKKKDLELRDVPVGPQFGHMWTHAPPQSVAALDREGRTVCSHGSEQQQLMWREIKKLPTRPAPIHCVR